jgi:hypothetical protein
MTVTPQTGLSGILHHCNTRYEWLVRPCSVRTFTFQETSSFAWRTNGERYPRVGKPYKRPKALRALGSLRSETVRPLINILESVS